MWNKKLNIESFHQNLNKNDSGGRSGHKILYFLTFYVIKTKNFSNLGSDYNIIFFKLQILDWQNTLKNEG